MSLVTQLGDVVGAAFADLGLDRSLGKVVPSQRPELADFQCNGAMAAAKRAGRAPRDIATDVVARLEDVPMLATVDVAGPGFINLTVTDAVLANTIESMHKDERAGLPSSEERQTVVVDYAGPNVAKAMHVGHLRATIIGDSLARIMEAIGHRVIRDPHFGDWGFQMGLLVTELEDQYPGLPYFEDPLPETFPQESPVTLEDLQTLYPRASERASSDDSFAQRAREATVRLQNGHRGYMALWHHMKRVSEESQRADFAALGVEFDLWYGESDVRDRIPSMIEALRESGAAVESEGALIIPVATEDDNRDIPPLILTTSSGGYLYSTTDLATIEFRVKDIGADLILYVVDSRQANHFTQVFRAARKGGIAPPALTMEHIGFGTMNGPDGKPFRTREGGVVRLADLISMVKSAAKQRLDEAEMAAEYPEEERDAIAAKVGIAALKFGDLINNRTSDYMLDLDRFTSFEGKTGPYLQYAAVRMGSILRRAGDMGLSSGAIVGTEVPVERFLHLELTNLPEVVMRAATLRAPNHLADYAFSLSGSFNRFYDVCHILSEEDATIRSSWLGLVETCERSLRLVLGMLGIEVPPRM
ncbi:MAG: arginine--tRNA ligase [Acidimicrobiia bacterium]|nr:arginine--tRNA ligase [Acidimicrobiia bacterium]